MGLLKRLVPTSVLVALDSLAQPSGALWQVTPSVFVRNQAAGPDKSIVKDAFWRCPVCGSLELKQEDDLLDCQGCKARWEKTNGVYNFKQPLPSR
jgi:hypothetical protein